MSHVQATIYIFSTLAYYKRRQPGTALSDENAKPEAQCHSKCGTIMIPPVLKITRPSQAKVASQYKRNILEREHKSIDQSIYLLYIYLLSLFRKGA